MKGTFRSHAEWKDRGACVESGFSVVFEILVCYKVGPMTGYKLGAHKMLKNSTVIYMGGITPVTPLIFRTFRTFIGGLIPFATSKGPPCTHGY